ncbi:MAG: flagellar basal body P-ring formation chaperone FlgA [Litoreibacter sp.]
MIVLRSIILACLPLPVLGDVVMPVHTIRANAVILIDDLKIKDVDMPGVITKPETIAGLEAKRNLYAGRPIRLTDVGPPAIVERNQVVTLKFQIGGLLIATEGRALDRAGIGDTLRVLNLSSRATVTGRIDENGIVIVSQ